MSEYLLIRSLLDHIMADDHPKDMQVIQRQSKLKYFITYIPTMIVGGMGIFSF